MKYFQETTEWNAGYKVPNHIYYMTDDKRTAVGYIRSGTEILVKFSQPMKIDTRGRKFVTLNKKGESDDVYFPKEKKSESTDEVRIVEGSNSKKYTLTKLNNKWTCSCPGFTFRNTCKHIKDI